MTTDLEKQFFDAFKIEPMEIPSREYNSNGEICSYYVEYPQITDRILTKSEPLIEKNGTPASPATAFANNVLPVPGGPTRSTPLGIRAPISTKRFGSFKKSTISFSSSFSSSAPATSAKRTFMLVTALAREWPKSMFWLF